MTQSEALYALGLAVLPGTESDLRSVFAAKLRAAQARFSFPPAGEDRQKILDEIKRIEEAFKLLLPCVMPSPVPPRPVPPRPTPPPPPGPRPAPPVPPRPLPPRPLPPRPVPPKPSPPVPVPQGVLEVLTQAVRCIGLAILWIPRTSVKGIRSLWDFAAWILPSAWEIAAGAVCLAAKGICLALSDAATLVSWLASRLGILCRYLAYAASWIGWRFRVLSPELRGAAVLTAVSTILILCILYFAPARLGAASSWFASANLVPIHTGMGNLASLSQGAAKSLPAQKQSNSTPAVSQPSWLRRVVFDPASESFSTFAHRIKGLFNSGRSEDDSPMVVIPPSPSRIHVLTFPVSDVYIDGRLVGESPSPQVLTIASGYARFRCVARDGDSYEFSEALGPGGAYTVRVNLRTQVHTMENGL